MCVTKITLQLNFDSEDFLRGIIKRRETVSFLGANNCIRRKEGYASPFSIFCISVFLV